MAAGISPYKTVTIPLGDYSADHYLVLLYHAMENRDWRIGYFDHDGIIAYTGISWSSYSEEISARVVDNSIVIKSECVGYQALFTDYGKNAENLELLLGEIEYAEFHLKDDMEQTTQELMDAVPEKQFLDLADPPMAGKEQLHTFFAFIIPHKKYFITPLLVIINTVLYFMSRAITIGIYTSYMSRARSYEPDDVYEKIYLLLGFNERSQVLNGQVWRLLTGVFLHFSFTHLAFNMMVLIYVGSLIESKLGRWNYLLLYISTGIIASMVSVIWHDHGVSAGASGAIFGLFGILLALLSTDFYERSARRALLISTAIFVGYNILPVGGGVDHAAHFGGLISGYVFGWLAYFGLKNKNKAVQQWGILISCVTVVMVFVSCSVLFTPKYQLKEFEKLVEQSHTMTTGINHSFYNYNLTAGQKLDSIETNALPELKKLGKLSQKFEALVLPTKLKREAGYRAKIITLECDFFNLLYLEFKNHDRGKYRPAIEADTKEINNLRIEWGKEDSGV